LRDQSVIGYCFDAHPTRPPVLAQREHLVFETLLFVVAVAAGGIAAVSGFGIGSLLTPVLALALDTRVAVAAVSVPHFIGTAFRLWRLGARPDRRVIWSFGLTSAAGGLAGALLHGWTANPALSIVFGALLAFTSASEWIGWSQRMQFSGATALVAGALSGMLGGLVGNQGGIRSAALLGFEMDRRTFVATATTIGLAVDAARMPLYFWQHAHELGDVVGWMAVATAGVLVGTVVGNRVLGRIPERHFRRIVAIVLAVLGLWMIVRGVRGEGG
jgi:uncharacterized membrane protein YfcA